MPEDAWSYKRVRQYEHIKKGLLARGMADDRAEEIAARTVNRSHRGSRGPTYDQLRNEAKERGIKGRSRMNKEQLERVLGR